MPCTHISQSNYTKSLQGKQIYKDQCVRCFHEPNQQLGLFVCMKCFNGFCKADLQNHINDHGHLLYLNIIMTVINVDQKFEITKVAVGVEGGALGEEQYKTQNKMYCGACHLHVAEADETLQPQIQSLLNTDSPFKKQSLVSWEVEILPCEHSLTLSQTRQNLNLQKCVNCELSTNLWLCLTCGNTGCGRKFWDGSGGNNHGIQHYQKTKHPLAVKLGTITTQGQASLYCYSCDNDVKDNLLQEHLIFLGIEIQTQKKTQKTVTQLNLEINLNFSLSKLVEGKNQKILFGGEFTGMNNIGNSCYLNSVVQALNCLDQYKNQYYVKGVEHIKTCKRIPAECFYCQICKIFWGLNSGKYSVKNERKRIINQQQVEEQYQQGIKPCDFKLLIAKGNAQFLSTHQQDALEYLQFLFEKLQKQEPTYGQVLSRHFNYEQTNRLVCQSCNNYKTITTKTNQWKFPIPLPSPSALEQYYAKLQKQSSEIQKAKHCQDPQYNVKFQECLDLVGQGDSVQVFCPKCKQNKIFRSQNYFKSTPKYLIAVPNRFVVQKWVPKKLNALIAMHQKFDISEFLLSNAKPVGQKLAQDKKQQTKYSQQNVTMLSSMGYSSNAAKRALIAKNNNIQQACNWIFENMQTTNLDAPLEEQNSQGGGGPEVNMAAVQMIKEMGFDETQSKIALLKNKNNPEAAIQWLFNVGGDVSSEVHLLAPKKQQKMEIESDKPKYTHYNLKAAILHLGKSVHSGHYVVYTKKNGEWILYNDEKVTVTSQPVLGKGYIYLYQGQE